MQQIYRNQKSQIRKPDDFIQEDIVIKSPKEKIY